MHITKIELDDIKSHRRFSHEFQRGTTAITGQNGAGKTTLIEAIGWTLFDLLDYKKDEFVRRGAKRGSARVYFVSSLDEREYAVYRDTATGYYVYDVKLKTRIADKKDEVARFLWSHLGVEPGTDLDALFRRAIGVPQGTFTAIFLETANERKKAFDKLLKVEEYRQGAEKLLQTARYVEQKINEARVRIGRAEGELARYDQEEENLAKYSEEVEVLTGDLEICETKAAEKREAVARHDETEKRVVELKTALDLVGAEKSKAGFLVAQKDGEVAHARAAASRIAEVESDHRAHLAALARLGELERERAAREDVERRLRSVEKDLVGVASERARVADQLEKSRGAAAELDIMRPKVAAQTALEERLAGFQQQLGQIRAKAAEIAKLEASMNDLRAKFAKNKEQIKEAESRTAAAADYERLAARDAEITREVTRFRAKLEHDEQFQAEVRGGLCPILSQKCLNLKPGETLESFLSESFAGAKTRIAELETEHKTVAEALRVAREAEKFTAALETLREREREIAEEGKKQKSEKESLLAALGDREKIETELADVERELRELGNPKAKIQMLEPEAKREPVLVQQLADIDARHEKLDAGRAELAAGLEAFRGLDSEWASATGERDRTSTAHREFLANENAAKVLPDKEAELTAANASLAALERDFEAAFEAHRAAESAYDRDLHGAERVALADFERRLAETRAHLANAEKLRKQTAAELDRLAAVRKAMLAEFEAKEKLEKAHEATEFIRDTLKKSAPLVAKNYIYYVSIEANQMFREITGNAERTLRWTEDYGVVLEEDGFERPFSSMSGGEQMAAALAVRLALLKQLSDIRVAFFDEPTTNLDGIRRERLAEQISRITDKQTFEQLFVISHDDTFEGYVDHVVTVGEETESEPATLNFEE